MQNDLSCEWTPFMLLANTEWITMWSLTCPFVHLSMIANCISICGLSGVPFLCSSVQGFQPISVSSGWPGGQKPGILDIRPLRHYQISNPKLYGSDCLIKYVIHVPCGFQMYIMYVESNTIDTAWMCPVCPMYHSALILRDPSSHVQKTQNNMYRLAMKHGNGK